MFVGLLATSLNVVVAVLIGGTAGFFGGKLDLVVQRFVDAWMAFPGLLLLLTIMSLVGQGLLQLILVLGVSGGVVASRLVRGAVIAVKENDYLQAATATGSTRMGTLVRHVLPNVAAPIIVVFSINIGAVIISEASLSFLGFGLSPEIPSWGTLLSRGRAQVHGAGAVAGAVARPVPDPDRLQPQHVRRRRPRPARPAPAGRRRTPRNPPWPAGAAQARSQAALPGEPHLVNGVAVDVANVSLDPRDAGTLG